MANLSENQNFKDFVDVQDAAVKSALSGGSADSARLDFSVSYVKQNGDVLIKITAVSQVTNRQSQTLGTDTL